jgi:hypothetical protein
MLKHEPTERLDAAQALTIIRNGLEALSSPHGADGSADEVVPQSTPVRKGKAPATNMLSPIADAIGSVLSPMMGRSARLSAIADLD